MKTVPIFLSNSLESESDQKEKGICFKERQRYSIRKYSFGATSVLIGASLMIGGHVLAQEQANSVSSSKDYEVIVNNSEAPQFEQAT